MVQSPPGHHESAKDWVKYQYCLSCLHLLCLGVVPVVMPEGLIGAGSALARWARLPRRGQVSSLLGLQPG